MGSAATKTTQATTTIELRRGKSPGTRTFPAACRAPTFAACGTPTPVKCAASCMGTWLYVTLERRCFSMGMETIAITAKSTASAATTNTCAASIMRAVSTAKSAAAARTRRLILLPHNELFDIKPSPSQCPDETIRPISAHPPPANPAERTCEGNRDLVAHCNPMPSSLLHRA